jgi:DNA-binding MarR family transcriptional regulator
MPYTFNLKGKKKQVNIIKLYEDKTIKRYNIDDLYKTYCTAKYQENNIDGRATTHIINNVKSIKPCVKTILENGSKDGSKNSDLQKIVINLRRLNKSLNDILYVCKEWNEKNENGLNEYELKYQVEYMFKNLESCDYNCKNCEYAKDCLSVIESDFSYGDGEEMINIECKVAKKLKCTKKDIIMDGNKLLIFNVLKHWEKDLSICDIVNNLTYNGKCALSERTIREVLPILCDEDYIIKINGNRRLGIPDKYKINIIKTKIDNMFSMSYFPTLICIYGIITPEELRLYTYMRFVHNENLKHNKSFGNIFRINQEDIAKDLNITQQRVSVMINNLIKSKILEIWEVKYNDRGLKYYTYRLVK